MVTGHSGGKVMIHKIKAALMKSVGMMLVMVALVASMVLSLSNRAQAFTVSVGTPTIVAAGVTIDNLAWTRDANSANMTHVVYSTSS